MLICLMWCPATPAAPELIGPNPEISQLKTFPEALSAIDAWILVQFRGAHLWPGPPSETQIYGYKRVTAFAAELAPDIPSVIQLHRATSITRAFPYAAGLSARTSGHTHTFYDILYPGTAYRQMRISHLEGALRRFKATAKRADILKLMEEVSKEEASDTLSVQTDYLEAYLAGQPAPTVAEINAFIASPYTGYYTDMYFREQVVKRIPGIINRDLNRRTSVSRFIHSCGNFIRTFRIPRTGS